MHIEINGNGNIVGDGNSVNYKQQINDEMLIRDEADDFTSVVVENYYDDWDGHTSFLQHLRTILSNFYAKEHKAIFLDQTKINIKEFLGDSTDSSPRKLTLNKMLFFVDQELNELPKIVKQNSSVESRKRNKVFFSYCHADKSYLEEFKRHIKPLEKVIDYWDDSRIDAGKKWLNEIESALEETKVGVLFISADFLGSQFIMSKELPPLIKNANEHGGTIITVFLRPSIHEAFPDIIQFQGINDPKRPISSLDENTREEIWVDLVRQIKKLLES